MCRAAASVDGRFLDAVGPDAAAHLLRLKALVLAERKQEGGEHAYIRNLLSWATVCGGYMLTPRAATCPTSGAWCTCTARCSSSMGSR